MINTHKELVGEIKIFSEKMELIKDFKYLKDIDSIPEVVMNSESRVFIMGLDSVQFDDEDYNITLNYRFALADEVLNDTDAILNSETENLFCISALGDYLSYIKNTEFSINDVDFSNESDNESTYCTAVGTFSFVIKRSASYWKKMEAYSAE